MKTLFFASKHLSFYYSRHRNNLFDYKTTNAILYSFCILGHIADHFINIHSLFPTEPTYDLGDNITKDIILILLERMGQPSD